MKDKNIFNLITGGSAKFVSISYRSNVYHVDQNGKKRSKIKADYRDQVLTDAGVPKTTPITCRKTVVASLNWEYSKVVQDRREREGNEQTFKARYQGRVSYGQSNSSVLYLEKDPYRWYLRFYNPQTVSETYWIGDRPASPYQTSLVKAGFYKKGKPKTQGIENAVVVRELKMSNVSSITYMGRTWEVFPPQSVIDEIYEEKQETV